tara:strand:- start:566 stop:976 length:411 start_codon:yes stop_codon:yes gene_type:complete
MNKFYVFLSCLLTANLALAETVYYCVDDLATGFIKDKGKWTQGKFSKTRFTIKFSDDYSTLTEDDIPHSCEPQYGDDSIDQVICRDIVNGGSFWSFNKKTKRFEHALLIGYSTDENPTLDEVHDTTTVQAGKCDTF